VASPDVSRSSDSMTHRGWMTWTTTTRVTRIGTPRRHRGAADVSVLFIVRTSFALLDYRRRSGRLNDPHGKSTRRGQSAGARSPWISSVAISTPERISISHVLYLAPARIPTPS